VIHLVSSTTPATAEQDPITDIEQNLLGSVRLLEICANTSGVQRLVYSSSGGTVYGNTVGPMAELSPTKPISPYGICKLAVEHYLQFFHSTSGLESVALRLANPYGKGQPLGRRQGVIPVFIENALSGRSAVVLGNGSMVRDYLYVTDVASAFAVMIEAPEIQHDTYNVGSGVGHSVSEIIECVAKCIGHPIETIHREAPKSFVQCSVLDTSRMRSEFNWRPEISLEEGISRTVKYVARQLRKQAATH